MCADVDIVDICARMQINPVIFKLILFFLILPKAFIKRFNEEIEL